MFSKGWLGTTTQAELKSQPLLSGVGPVFFCGWSLLGRVKGGRRRGLCSFTRISSTLHGDLKKLMFPLNPEKLLQEGWPQL